MSAVPQVCFDLGGVMIRIRHRWGEVLGDLDLTPFEPRADYGALIDFPGIEAFQSGDLGFEEYLGGLSSYLGGLSVEDAARVHAHILWEEYPGSLELVRGLRDSEVRVGCLSNTNEPHIRECMESGRFPVCHAFERLVTSYELGLNKPQPEIYRTYEELMGVGEEGVVFFDDSRANVDGARAVGWRAFLIDPGGDTAVQIREGLSLVGIRA